MLNKMITDEGRHIYYYPLSNELVLSSKKPKKYKKMNLCLFLNGKKIMVLGEVVYIGEL